MAILWYQARRNFAGMTCLAIGATLALAGPALGQSQSDMAASSGQTLKASDARLNAAYKVVMARLSTGSKARLTAAQRSWIQWRDNECLFRSQGPDGGSAGTMVYLDCQAELTLARARQLEGFRSCQEGDLSCPR